MNTGMRPFEDEETERVLQSFYGPNAVRNRCLFVLAINTGFRISEILSIDVDDVICDGRIVDRITVRRSKMKGGYHSRAIAVNASARQHLQPYLAERSHQKTLLSHTPLFVTSTMRRLTRQAAWQALTTAYRLAGVGPRGIGTHGLRKTFAARMHAHFVARQTDKPIDVLFSLQRALGHAKIQSTVHYLSFLESDIDDAVKAIGS